MYIGYYVAGIVSAVVADYADLGCYAVAVVGSGDAPYDADGSGGDYPAVAYYSP